MISLTKVTAHLLLHRKKYIVAFWMGQALLLSFFITSVVLEPLHRYWAELGQKMADGALLCLVASLLPGILKRLKVTGSLIQFQIILMTFRRQLGISVFLFANYHNAWSRVLFLLRSNHSLLPDMTYEIIGMTALTLLLPLFLTSNDFSVRVLGKSWKILHKIIYVVAWMILVHVILLRGIHWTSLIIGVTCILELVSWIKQRTMTLGPSEPPHSLQSSDPPLHGH